MWASCPTCREKAVRGICVCFRGRSNPAATLLLCPSQARAGGAEAQVPTLPAALPGASSAGPQQEEPAGGSGGGGFMAALRRSFQQRSTRVAPDENHLAPAGAGGSTRASEDRSSGAGPVTESRVAGCASALGGAAAALPPHAPPLDPQRSGGDEAGACWAGGPVTEAVASAPPVFSSWLRRPPQLPSRSSSLDSLKDGVASPQQAPQDNSTTSPSPQAAPPPLPSGHPALGTSGGAAAAAGGGFCPMSRATAMALAAMPGGGGGMGGCPVFKAAPGVDAARFFSEAPSGRCPASGAFGQPPAAAGLGFGGCPIAKDAPLAEIRWIKGEPRLVLAKRKKAGDEAEGARAAPPTKAKKKEPVIVERDVRATVKTVGGTPTLLLGPREDRCDPLCDPQAATVGSCFSLRYSMSAN